ncbi:DNA-binding protein [Streptomyces albus]|uniref:nSTAND1 domain-containing NTPase n=1 Tax=Streptomyces albus TaxID=1888 RepID=UPI0024AE02C6|nr:DNA-binding protein [Streptomyces albus]MDI6407686.1 DNA-binding protein [Streptomyces albus]
MGRRERPVDPAEGPVQQFAYELRKLREEAGRPTYRQLAARCGYSVTTLSQAAAGERLPSLAATLAYVTACGGDPAEWERRWRAAGARETEERARVRDTAGGPDTQEPPYRGLARFEPGDHDRFFGREELTAELLALVADRRFAAVFGPSGSGKSSLLRAGLIPRLRDTGGTEHGAAGAGTPAPGGAGASACGAGGGAGARPRVDGTAPGGRGTVVRGDGNGPSARARGNAAGAGPGAGGAGRPVGGTRGSGARPVAGAQGCAGGEGGGEAGPGGRIGGDGGGAAGGGAGGAGRPAGGTRGDGTRGAGRPAGGVRGDGTASVAGAQGHAGGERGSGAGPAGGGQGGVGRWETGAGGGLPPSVPRPAAVRILTPGEHPARTHAAACTPAPAATGPGDGPDAADQGDTWILVDQFEEVFTLCHDPVERARFLDLLLRARDPDSRLRVVIAVRADFYGRCAEHRALAEALCGSGLLVGPMTSAELRAAVVRPAAAHGLIVERALTARLLRDAEREPGALPLVSHALLETWRRRKGRALTLQAYEAAGGVHGAVAQTAEDVYTRLSPHQAALARRILLRLIAPGEGAQDTRRPAPRAELECDSGDPAGGAGSGYVLERLVAARLLTLDGDTVDLAHEALITSWPRLRRWIDEDRERLRAHRRLTEAAHSWQELDRDPGALYRGSRLAEATELFGSADTGPGHRPHRRSGPYRLLRGHSRRRDEQRYVPGLTRLERDFLTACHEERRRERRRRGGGVAAVCLLLTVALLAGVVAWQQTRANTRQHTEAEARRIAAVADSMRMSDPRLAMRLSVAAWRLADTHETRAALLGALAQPEEDALTLPSGSRAGSERFLSDDGRTLVSAGGGRLNRWDVAEHRETTSVRGPGSPDGEAGPVRAALTPDGALLATADRRLRITLRPTTGGAARTLPGARGTPAVFSTDGRLLWLHGPAGAHRATAQLWDVHGGRPVLQRRTAAGREASVAVSRSGGLAAVCPGRAALELWRLGTTRPRHAVRLPLDGWPARARHAVCRARTLTFAPGDRRLVGLDGRGVHAWDVATGRHRQLAAQRGLTGMRLSGDGELLVGADSTRILVWRPALSRRPVLRYPLVSEYVSGLGVDPRAGVVRYLSGLTGQTVRTLSLAGAHRVRRPGPPLGHAVFSPDGRHLATARARWPHVRFELRDARTGAVVRRLPAGLCHGTAPGAARHAPCTPLMAFDRKGGTFAYGTGSRSPGGALRQTVHLWDTRTHRHTGRLPLTPGPRDRRAGQGPGGIAFTRDGRHLLVSRTPGAERVEVWDVGRHRRTRVLRHTGGDVLAVRPTGQLLATSHGQLASPVTGRVLRRVLSQDETHALAFSPDGRVLAAGDGSGRVTLWDGRGRRSLGLLAGTYREAGGSTEPVTALAFSPDGGTLAVAGRQGTVRLWDTAAHQPLGGPLPTGRDHAVALAFSPDGGELYVAGSRFPVRRYTVAPRRAASRLCARGHGGLTPAQWHAALRDVPYRPTC